MITFIKQNKLFVIVSICFVLGLLYYIFSMNSGPASSSAPLTTSDQTGPSAASQQLLVVLANLRTIRLDDSIFKDSVYLSLSDFGVVISPESVGRRFL